MSNIVFQVFFNSFIFFLERISSEQERHLSMLIIIYEKERNAFITRLTTSKIQGNIIQMNFFPEKLDG